MKFGKIETQYGVVFKDQTELTTADIPYANPDHPDLTTMKGALDRLLYKPLELILNPLSSVELGQSIPYVDLTWSLSTTPDSLSINGVGPIDTTLRTYRVNGPFTQRVTFTLNASKGTVSRSASVVLAFNNRVYWGASNKGLLTANDLIGLTGQAMPNKEMAKTISTNSQYIYLAWPSRLGDGLIKVNGLINSAWVKTNLDVTNPYGYTEPYLVYRSTFIQNGSGILVEVF